MDMTISSQASEESVEGSTTNAHVPERDMKRHERAGTKTCKICKVEKDIKLFRVGLRFCNACRCDMEKQRYADPEYRARHLAKAKEYYAAKRAEVLKQKSEYGKRPEIAERDKKRRRERYAADKDFALRTKKRRDNYYAKNPEVFRARDAKRRALALLAMPKWANKALIKKLYKEAAEKTKATGIKHEVDHRVPLQGRTVCGLHVEYNLRVISEFANRSKANKLVHEIV